MSITNRFTNMLAGLGLLLFSFNISAYPLLTFDGGMNYNSESSVFSFGAGLTGSQDISSTPKFAGSSFRFSSLLDTSSVSTNSLGTAASFTGTTSGSNPYLRVIDGDGVTLLDGELTGLMMGGLNDTNTGALNALFNPISGTLLNDFTVGAKLFSLQLNLTTKFGSSMFASGFSGNVKGKLYAPISAVPEPGVLILLMLGLGLLIVSSRKKDGQKFSHHVN